MLNFWRGEKCWVTTGRTWWMEPLGRGRGGENVRWGQSSNLYIFTVSAQSSVPSRSFSSTWKLVRNAESQAHPRTTESESAFLQDSQVNCLHSKCLKSTNRCSWGFPRTGRQPTQHRGRTTAWFPIGITGRVGEQHFKWWIWLWKATSFAGHLGRKITSPSKV